MLKLPYSAHAACVDWFSDKVSLFFKLYLGGGVSSILVTMSFEVVVPLGGFSGCTVKWFACVMVNSMFLYPAGMMNHFVMC